MKWELAIEKLHQLPTAVHITCWFSNFCDQGKIRWSLAVIWMQYEEQGREMKSMEILGIISLTLH